MLALEVLKALAKKPVRLTGNEIRFVGLQADMTLKAVHTGRKACT